MTFTNDETLFIESLLDESPDISDDEILDEVGLFRQDVRDSGRTDIEITTPEETVFEEFKETVPPQAALQAIEQEKAKREAEKAEKGAEVLQTAAEAGAPFVKPIKQFAKGIKQDVEKSSLAQQAFDQLLEDPDSTKLEQFVGTLGKILAPAGEPASSVFAGVAPFGSAGLISKEEFKEETGLPDRPTLEGVGTAAGLAAQIPAVATGVQAAGRGIAKVAPKVGAAIAKGGATTAATEGAVFGALQEGDLEERAKSAALGGAIGGAVGGLLQVPKVLKGLQKKFANIDEGLESVLNPVKNLSKTEQAQFIKTGLSQPERASKLERFLASAEQNATNPRAASAMDLAIDSVDRASNQIDDLVKTAGKNVGSAKTAAGDKVVSGIDDVIASVKSDAAKRFNVNIDDKLKITARKGREKLLNSTDETRLVSIMKELQSLKKSPTLFRTNDIIKRIDDTVDFEQALLKQDKLEKFIKQTRGKLNEKQIASDKLLGEANKRFHELKDIQSKIFKATGGKDTRTVTVLKRALSERGKDIKDLFQQVAKETGEDLFEDIMFAKFATESLGGEQAVSVLEQVIGKGARGGALGVIEAAGAAAKKGLIKPAEVARKIVKEPAKQAPSLLERIRK